MMATETSFEPVRTLSTARLARIQRRHAFSILVLPPILVIVLCCVLPKWQPGPTEWIALTVMYAIAGFGVDVGFHRYFTHRSFACNRLLQAIFAISGMMAAPGTLLSWVATHRQHHENSDSEDDPHSPYVNGNTSLAGLWHSHAGWLFTKPIANPIHYAPDIVRDPLLATLNQMYLAWVVLGYLVPFAIGWIVHETLAGALLTLLWGGAIRMFVEHHVILSVNSICHWWGTRRYPTRDESRNNLLLAVPSLGEAFHNNHHAFPTSAIYGHRWWEIDLGGYVVRALQVCGLIWNVRMPYVDSLKPQ